MKRRCVYPVRALPSSNDGAIPDSVTLLSDFKRSLDRPGLLGTSAARRCGRTPFICTSKYERNLRALFRLSKQPSIDTISSVSFNCGDRDRDRFAAITAVVVRTKTQKQNSSAPRPASGLSCASLVSHADEPGTQYPDISRRPGRRRSEPESSCVLKA